LIGNLRDASFGRNILGLKFIGGGRMLLMVVKIAFDTSGLTER
jgi:hypothetical protein